MTFGLSVHNLAVVIWVGGMFFALVVLRPSAGHLDPAVCLALWERVLQRFFVWSWLMSWRSSSADSRCRSSVSVVLSCRPGSSV
jgi:hypothetical protein